MALSNGNINSSEQASRKNQGIKVFKTGTKVSIREQIQKRANVSTERGSNNRQRVIGNQNSRDKVQ